MFFSKAHAGPEPLVRVADSRQEGFEGGGAVSGLAVYIKCTGVGDPVPSTSLTLSSPEGWQETSSPTELLLGLE